MYYRHLYTRYTGLLYGYHFQKGTFAFLQKKINVQKPHVNKGASEAFAATGYTFELQYFSFKRNKSPGI